MTRIFGEQFGLLHDVDFECYPEEHCKKAPELLKEIDASDELIHAVCSHGYGICSDVEPTHEMEKILFATDELTGLIWAAAKMRPSNSTKDMEVSSLKKKFKDKKMRKTNRAIEDCDILDGSKQLQKFYFLFFNFLLHP